MTKKLEEKFKETEIELIPEEWNIFSFGEVADINPKRELKKGNNSKFVTMASIKTFTKKVSNYSYKEFSGGSKFKNGDTLMARITPCLENGKTSYVDFLENNEVAGGSTEFIVLSGKDKVSDSNFVYYLTTSSMVREAAIKAMTGTSGRQRVENDKFSNFLVSLPSLNEQRKIAEILSSLDDKIELNRKINDNLEKIASALFKRWFVDFEFPDKDGKPYKFNRGKIVDSESGEIPSGWKFSFIGRELKTFLGGTPSRANNEYWNNGIIPWINSGAINDFPVMEPSQYITADGLRNSAAKLMPIKTVVLPFVISVGKNINISILGLESSGNQSVLGVVGNEKIKAEYAYYWINNIKDKIYACATGGAQQHINKSNVDESEILIPSDDIIKKFEYIAEPIFDLLILNSKELLKLSNLRNSLLPRLMSGKIRVNL